MQPRRPQWPCTSKAFNSTCKKCSLVVQYTCLCKRGEKKKDEEVSANSVQVMYSTMGANNINQCQFTVSWNEIEYDRAIKKQLQTRPNVTLSNEEYHKMF